MGIGALDDKKLHRIHHADRMCVVDVDFVALIMFWFWYYVPVVLTAHILGGTLIRFLMSNHMRAWWGHWSAVEIIVTFKLSMLP
jgi:hypothetical protein